MLLLIDWLKNKYRHHFEQALQLLDLSDKQTLIYRKDVVHISEWILRIWNVWKHFAEDELHTHKGCKTHFSGSKITFVYNGDVKRKGCNQPCLAGSGRGWSFSRRGDEAAGLKGKRELTNHQDSAIKPWVRRQFIYRKSKLQGFHASRCLLVKLPAYKTCKRGNPRAQPSCSRNEGFLNRDDCGWLSHYMKTKNGNGVFYSQLTRVYKTCYLHRNKWLQKINKWMNLL